MELTGWIIGVSHHSMMIAGNGASRTLSAVDT